MAFTANVYSDLHQRPSPGEILFEKMISKLLWNIKANCLSFDLKSGGSNNWSLKVRRIWHTRLIIRFI